MPSAMPEWMPEALRRGIRYWVVRPRACRPLPAHLARRHASTPPATLDQLAGLLAPRTGRDLQDHLTVRLNNFRHSIVPWLDQIRPLNGLRILEIGCGTGASTLALAEQGAQVTALDLDVQGMAVAEARCRLAGIPPGPFVVGNAARVTEYVNPDAFDLIIYFAALEHMTNEERMRTMRATFDGMRPDALWCVIETPNRLWYHDHHTSLLPFFHWLPDDLATAYAQFSPRPGFVQRMRTADAERPLRLARSGRGMSFHECDLALGRGRWRVQSCMEDWLAHRQWPRGCLWSLTLDGQYESFLNRLAPGLPTAFKHEYLNLVLTRMEGGSP